MRHEISPIPILNVMNVKSKTFSLKTFLLSISVIAVWTAYFVLNQQVIELKSKLWPLRVVANSLIVDDPEQIAVVRNPGDSVISHLEWQVYLPPVGNDESFVLCLAQDPDSTPKLPSVKDEHVQTFPISPGTHEITFMPVDFLNESYVNELRLDGEALAEFEYQTRGIADWEVFFESSSVQQPADQPFVFCPTSWTKDFESYLWIEKVKR